MNKKIYIIILIFLPIFLSFNISFTAYADKCNTESTFLGIPRWNDGLCRENTDEIEISQEEPMNDVILIILNVLSIVIRISSYIAVGLVIWGGFQYILAAGDSSKISNAKKTISNALIGLLIALSAIAIVAFVKGAL